MRQGFEQQFNLLVTTISEVKITLKSRDDLAPMMAHWPYLYFLLTYCPLDKNPKSQSIEKNALTSEIALEVNH
jgi:hypothetical protein